MKFKIITLTTIPIAFTTPVLAISCNDQTYQEPSPKPEPKPTPVDATKVKRQKLITTYNTFKTNYFEYIKQFKDTPKNFLIANPKINQFVKEYKNYIKSIYELFKELKINNFRVVESEAKKEQNKELVAFFNRWFKFNGTWQTSMRITNLFNSVGIIKDAEIQIDSNVPYLNYQDTEIFNSTSLLRYFESLGEKQIEDKKLQRSITKTYTFLKSYIFDIDEELVFDINNLNDPNHSPISTEHTHSHAILNIVHTALTENIRMLQSLDRLTKEYHNFARFVDPYDMKWSITPLMKKIKNVKKWQDTLQEIVDKTIKPMKNEFIAKLYSPLEEMVKALGFKNVKQILNSST